VPKTLIFAKDDSHAEDIVRVFREEFGKGNDFAKKITYRTTGDKPEDLIASFRNSYNPRVAVTVDMISTGTDIKPLECLLFMRDVKSRVYFEQMKGRGSRTIDPTDFNAVTPDAAEGTKTHFVIVDAVGVCESDKTDSRPLERKKSLSFDKLLQSVALGNRDEDMLTSLAGRLSRLDQSIDANERQEIQAANNGESLHRTINALLDAVDPDKRVEHAKTMFGPSEPSEEQIEQATTALANTACLPFDDPDFRNLLCDIRKRQEQTIDTVSQDSLIDANFDAGAKERAESAVTSFRQFIEDNKDEITALQILYSRPYGQRHLTHASIRELAQAISQPPLLLSAEKLWQAYEQLETAKVRKMGPQRLLTNLISLVRFAVGQAEMLEPFPLTVDQKFEQWLAEQQRVGKTFSSEQLDWLEQIKSHVAANVEIDMGDFELTPFFEKGGPFKAAQLFGEELSGIMKELTEVLVA